MLAATQDLQDLSIGAFTSSSLDWNFPFTDVTPSIPQLSDNAESATNPYPGAY